MTMKENKYIYKSKKNTRKYTILLLLGFIVISLVLLGLEISGTIDLYKRSNTDSTKTTKPVNTVNYDPPTDEEKNAGDIKKEEIVQNESEMTNNTSGTNLISANIVIVDASQYDSILEVRAFASNVLENGTCTITFTKQGAPTVTKKVSAFADASTTPCTTASFDRTEFASGGVWSMVLTFESASSNGTATKEVTVE